METVEGLDDAITMNEITIMAICDADFRNNDTTSSFFMIHFTVEQIQKLYLSRRERLAVSRFGF
jgi:hypothetical protein